MYNINVSVKYNDNYTYRQCLRNVANMDKNSIHVPWEQMDNDLDDETKDELLYDCATMTTIMDKIYNDTKKDKKFKELYNIAAAQMFSVDDGIGLAILFSYDYFEYFHCCLQDFYKTNSISNDNYTILKNKLC
jgi:hypothetical protein